MAHSNIFVVGLDEFHLAQLKALRKAKHYRFHPLFHYEEIRGVAQFPVKEFLREAEKQLKAFPDPVDAIVGYWDFPVSTLLPILRTRLGLLTPTLESVLKCEHKYWSRLEQATVISDNVPRFTQVNPFAEDPLAAITLSYPFWLKPVRSVLSHLGFRINNATEFHNSITRIRQGIARYAEPFNYLLRFAKLPEKIAAIDGYHCIAEAMIASRYQCTLEGYVHAGDVQVYGAIDSLREGPHESCFSCYRYPSTLPQPVQQRMVALTKRVITHIGYDNAPFNVEFFWNETTDKIWLLEINTRISKSHCPLFYLVDGEYHHQVMIDTALGNRPAFPHRQGRFNCAAKFMLRRYEDALVTRVPTPAEINRVKARWPDVIVQIYVQEGVRLSQLHDQDSYSYEIAALFMGADNHQSLLEKYHQCRDMLPLEFASYSQQQPTA